MIKLSGAAAEARLAEAWEMIFGQDPTVQQIIHVLARPTGHPEWVSGFPPFEAWMRNGRRANEEIWNCFAEIAESWSYIENARRAVDMGIPDVRIFVLKRATRESEPLWVQYLSEVHLPAIAALVGEKLYRVWAEDCRDAGLPDRDYDVNLYGAAGVMLAGGENGDIDWRAFLADDPDPYLLSEEHGFISSMREFASSCGELVELPSKIQPRSGLRT